MKTFIVIDRENNKLKELLSNNIENIKNLYEDKEVIEKPKGFVIEYEDLRYYTNELKLKDFNTLISEGIESELLDDEGIENNRRVKLDEVSFYKKNHEKEKYREYFKLKKLDKDTNEVEYLRELTMIEQLEKGYITSEEYNNYQVNMRRYEYSTKTDNLIIEKTLELLKKNGIDVSDIEVMKAKIKEDYPKA